MFNIKNTKHQILQFFLFFVLFCMIFGISAFADPPVAVGQNYDAINTVLDTSANRIQNIVAGPIARAISLIAIVLCAIVIIMFPKSNVAALALRIFVGLFLLRAGFAIMTYVGLGGGTETATTTT